MLTEKEVVFELNKRLTHAEANTLQYYVWKMDRHCSLWVNYMDQTLNHGGSSNLIPIPALIKKLRTLPFEVLDSLNHYLSTLLCQNHDFYTACYLPMFQSLAINTTDNVDLSKIGFSIKYGQSKYDKRR